MTKAATSPVSFRVSVVRLPQKGMPVIIDADKEQRRLLAEEHGLLECGRFHASVVVSNWKSDGVKVAGHVEADIVQACVVSLDPLSSRIETTIEALYVPENSRLSRIQMAHQEELLLSAEGPDAPEPFTGDWIDVGALAEEHFSLAIDPYPRKEGAELGAETLSAGAGFGDGPLAEKLAVLKRALK